MSKSVEWTYVYAVARLPVPLADDSASEIKVVSVWPDADSAEAEAGRLNELNTSKGVRYIWQSTHLFAGPRGDRTGGDERPQPTEPG